MSIKSFFQVLALALALFASVANAAAISTIAPQSINPAEEVKHTLVKREDSIYCKGYSYTNKSTPASPFLADCRAIAVAHQGGDKRYTIKYRARGFIELDRYKTCVFGARARNQRAYLGERDMVTLIEKSIDQFTWFEKVGAEGALSCYAVDTYGQLKESVGVEWALYNTGYRAG